MNNTSMEYFEKMPISELNLFLQDLTEDGEKDG